MPKISIQFFKIFPEQFQRVQVGTSRTETFNSTHSTLNEVTISLFKDLDRWGQQNWSIIKHAVEWYETNDEDIQHSNKR